MPSLAFERLKNMQVLDGLKNYVGSDSEIFYWLYKIQLFRKFQSLNAVFHLRTHSKKKAGFIAAFHTQGPGN